MHVKKYQASSFSDAMSLVKKDMGPDALILSTRRLPPAQGRGEAERFEITAASGRTDKGYGDTGAWGKETEAPEATLGIIHSELLHIKDLLSLGDRLPALMEGFVVNPGAMAVYAALVRKGVDRAHAGRILETSGAFTEPVPSLGELWSRVCRQVLEAVPVINPFEDQGRRVVCGFVGPTGVGKTTTIAKLAAELGLKHKKKVGLISIDNYRVSAMDQLKTYAGIMGVPCFPAFTKDDLRFALERMEHKDVVLIDTAGQSHYDMDRMEELANLLGGENPPTNHLVLSAVTDEEELRQAAHNFARLRYSSYVFTKADETKKHGVILNQVLRQPAPVSFITDGQRVPEDIHWATRDVVARLLFKECRVDPGQAWSPTHTQGAP